MPDPYSGNKTNQELRVEEDVVQRLRDNKLKELQEKKAKGEKKGKNPPKPVKVGELYRKGCEALERHGYIIELCRGGDHVNHRIYVKQSPPVVKGVDNYPGDFQPYQECDAADLFDRLEDIFLKEEDGVRQFWEPIYHPKGGDSDLKSFVDRKLGMQRIQKQRELNEILTYHHSFDPCNSLGRGVGSAKNPRIWVPCRDWFCSRLSDVKFDDIFTIFPPAEREILKLLIGRVGVGRTNHLPPGWETPVNHTARMAAIVVGKDPGLGKSTLFNGLLNAISKVGLRYHTFRATDDRFGMREPALADVAYKDDTSLASLKKLISSEETKILITNGLLQTEEKFEHAEQIWPKSVLIVNANDWNASFAYDIDPGIQDRIKLVSTYREAELVKLRDQLTEDSASYGSPDLRPRAHIPFLAEKYGVSEEALYLWALRLATDRFWEVISDDSDPSINRLQVEVRYWTSRLRIRFKSDVTQSLVNGMALSWAIRTGKTRIPELTPDILVDALENFYFVGVDPSCQKIHEKLKESWERGGRTATHFYQGFREIRWESVKKAVETQEAIGRFNNTMESVKRVIESLTMRDGFKLGGTFSYIVENWENMRFAYSDFLEEAQDILSDEEDWVKSRVENINTTADDSWIDNPDYSPDIAEELRELEYLRMAPEG